jgi:hypothetical protein
MPNTAVASLTGMVPSVSLPDPDVPGSCQTGRDLVVAGGAGVTGMVPG